jgi:hypothetical protein
MKSRTFTAVLIFMVITFSTSIAYAAPPSIDLVGLWRMTMDIVDKNGITYSNPNNPEYEYFVVEVQDGYLFKGFGCPGDSLYPERTDFYGVMEGRNIHITSNDAIAFGAVNQAGTEMEVINQVQGYKEICDPPDNPVPGDCDESENISATQRVLATKVDDYVHVDCSSTPAP